MRPELRFGLDRRVLEPCVLPLGSGEVILNSSRRALDRPELCRPAGYGGND